MCFLFSTMSIWKMKNNIIKGESAIDKIKWIEVTE